MDGLEASRRLQAELAPSRRPVVVALSADTLQELHEQCRDAGIREFICKPFRWARRSDGHRNSPASFQLLAVLAFPESTADRCSA